VGVDRGEQAARAAQLRALHHGDTPLVLPNAWDAASAADVVAAGFAVVATTSGGIAASLGYADGEHVPAHEMFAAVARIAGTVDVPVTADIESGYGLPAAEVARRLVEAGAVGCNLEDTDHSGGLVLRSTEEQVERIEALRASADHLGVNVVVNARVDVFVRREGEPAERVDLALERADAYQRAGADCVYPILASEEEIARFVAGHDGPVNGMVFGDLALSRLGGLGVARISFGSGLHRRAQSGLRRALDAIARWDDDWSSPPT
jgi:2-methylisocitrate lyase-like PEP mutase family enzyme